MNDPQPFPLDSATLIMLAAACEVNEDTGRSHLQDFLHMGSRESSREDITHEVFSEEGAPPVYFVEYEDGAAPFSPHDAIRALVGEVLKLREASQPLARLPYPLTADERTEWLTYQQKLRAALVPFTEAKP